MKALKYALLGVAALALAAALAIAYLAFAFDPRDYQPRIVELVRERTGRTLQIQGEIKLSVWPDLGIRLGAVSLSEHGSAERFADVDNVRLTVKLVPLFSRELIVDELLVQGAHVRITRYADGHLNIDDLLKSKGGALQFDIHRVKLERSTLSYLDLGSGAHYELSGIDLETGRLANAVATPVKLALRVSDGAHRFDLVSSLDARLTLDPGRETYALDEASLHTTGRIASLTNASLEVKGSFGADLKSGRFRAAQLSTVMRGTVQGETIDASLDALAVAFAPGQASAESAQASLRATGVAGTTRLDLKLQRVARDADTLSADAAAWDLDLRRGGRTVQVSAVSPVEASIAARTVHLAQVQTRFTASGAPLSGKGVSGALTGNASLDIAREAVQASFNGRIDDSTIKAELKAVGFAAPAYTFMLAVDQLDLDRYAAKTAARKSSAHDVDLASLSTLPATGTLTIGVLRTGGVKATNVKLAIKP